MHAHAIRAGRVRVGKLPRACRGKLMPQVECAQKRQYQQALNKMPIERIMSVVMVITNGEALDENFTRWDDRCRQTMLRLAGYRGAVERGMYTDYPQEGR